MRSGGFLGRLLLRLRLLRRRVLRLARTLPQRSDLEVDETLALRSDLASRHRSDFDRRLLPLRELRRELLRDLLTKALQLVLARLETLHRGERLRQGLAIRVDGRLDLGIALH